MLVANRNRLHCAALSVWKRKIQDLRLTTPFEAKDNLGLLILCLHPLRTGIIGIRCKWLTPGLLVWGSLWRLLKDPADSSLVPPLISRNRWSWIFARGFNDSSQSTLSLILRRLLSVISALQILFRIWFDCLSLACVCVCAAHGHSAFHRAFNKCSWAVCSQPKAWVLLNPFSWESSLLHRGTHVCNC